MTSHISRRLASRRGFAAGAPMRALLATLAVVLSLVTLGEPVRASEAEGAEERPPVRSEGTWSSGGAYEKIQGEHLWSWPEGGRLYHFLDPWEFNSYDADTGMRIASFRDGSVAGYRAGRMASPHQRHHVVIDRAGGRIFIARGADALSSAAGKGVCPTVQPAWQCFVGVDVLDARTLELLGRISLKLPSAENPYVFPLLRAMEYAPADSPSGTGGRLLMVIEEMANGMTEDTDANTVAGQSGMLTARRNGANIPYAVAFDPDSMRQEWAVRVEACRFSREGRTWQSARALSDPSAIFRVEGEAPAVYVGCHATAAQTGVAVRIPLDSAGIPAGLPVAVGDPVAAIENFSAPPSGSGVVAVAARQESFPGPDKVMNIIADPRSQRLLMRVVDAGEVWWVFDGKLNQFIGTIGVGPYTLGETLYGLDPDIGRLYLRSRGGLFLVDVRRSPLPQALVYPELMGPGGSGQPSNLGSPIKWRSLSVVPRGDREATRIFDGVPLDEEKHTLTDQRVWQVLVDESPPGHDSAPEAEPRRSLDLVEAAGVTSAVFDGTARAFGFRAILLGGVEGAARVGPADPVGVARGVPDLRGPRRGGVCELQHVMCYPELATQMLPRPDPCTDAQRELVAAFVGPRGPAVVDAAGARGEAEPLLVDVRTRDDLAAPVTRCGPASWEKLFETALVGRPPVSEPGVDWPFEDARTSCASTEQDSSDSWSDPVLGLFSASVDCGDEAASGWGQARGLKLEDVSVGEAMASFRIYRDTERGMVARVDSVARGIDIAGLVRIGTVRGSAESWANGRSVAEDAPVDQSVFNPFNCDRTRPAGTCFQRHVFGVDARLPGGGHYGCGPCGDEGALIDGINRALGSNGYARFREPDRELARGSSDGYQAAITKKANERFADIVLNADLLETMVPMLEVVRTAPANRPEERVREDYTTYYTLGTPPRGKQVYQFAGVEVSSVYGIQCLLVYDEASSVCAEAVQAPGSLKVSLAGEGGSPLPGGAFAVRRDVDADGVLGRVDTLLPDGACVTGEDGIGTCAFDGLEPGGYLVEQVSAPPGYAAATEPFPVELAAGEQRTVTFTNLSNVSTVQLTALDGDGRPLAGAVFSAYPDPDADGKADAQAQPAATCTTDEAGVCSMRMPAGSYVLVQSSAPGGFEPIEPVPFTFASGGQVATVSVVNYPPEVVHGDAPAETVPVRYEAAPLPPAPTVHTDIAPTDSVPAPETAPPVREQVGGTIVRVISAPGDALRLLAREPGEAVAWIAALGLFLLAMAAVQRRQHLVALLAVPTLALDTARTAPGGRAPHRPQPPGPPTRPGGGGGASRPVGRTGERRVVAGGGAAVAESVTARVVAATADPALASLIGQRLAVSEHCTLLATVSSLEAFRTQIEQSPPDVVIVDLGLTDSGVTDVATFIAELHPAERAVGLIPPGRSVEEMTNAAHRAGLGGLLAAIDDLGNGQLSYAVRCVASGKPFYGPTVQAVMLRSAGAVTGRRAQTDRLTAREWEVATLAAEGLRRSEIAERLFLSPLTVKRHLHVIRTKLGVTNPWDRQMLERRLEEEGLAQRREP